MPFIDVRGLKLYYETKGEGPRLLVLLGSGSDLRQTPNIFATPLCEQFEVLAFDQRGQGQSDAPDEPYTMADYADDAAALLQEMGWDRCHVLGISFGGMVAQELAIRHPDVVERLILACTSSGGAGGASFALHELAGMDKQARVDALMPVFDVRWAEGYETLGPQPRSSKRHLTKRLEAMMTSAEDPDKLVGMARQLGARLGHDTFERLPEIKAPTLVCGGRFDGIAPPKNSWEIYRQIPNARLAMFDGGHLFFQEDASAFGQFGAFFQDAEPVAAVAMERGMIAYLGDKFDEARAHFEEALVAEANHPAAQFYVGECYRIDDKGKTEDAVAVWKKLEEAHPDTPWALLAKAQILHHGDESNLYGAKAVFDELIEAHPTFALGYNYRGDLQDDLNSYYDANIDFEKAISLNGGDMVSFQNRVSPRLRQGQLAEAQRDAAEAVRLAPYYVQAHTCLGETLEKLARYSEALDTYDRALALAPNDEFVLVHRGTIYVRDQRWEEAMNDFEKVLSVDPKDADALAGRGDIHFAKGDNEAALSDYDKAISGDAADVWRCFLKRGFVHQTMGNLDSAINDYNETLCRQYEAVDALINRGLAYKEKGLYDLAFNDFNDALCRKDEDAYAHNNRGAMYMLRNQPEAALRDFSEAIKRDETEPEFFFNRANASEETGDLPGTINDLQRYIDLSGSDAPDYAAVVERVAALQAKGAKKAC